MDTTGRMRVAAVSLVLSGAVILGIGLNAVLNPPCASVRYLCPKAGCVPTQCPTTLDYLTGLAWGIPGAALIVVGVVLYRRADDR